MATVEQTKGMLTQTRKRNQYNEAEQQFSVVLKQRLQEVLEGRRNSLALLRRYPADEHRIGVPMTSSSISRDDLRLPVVETMVWEAVSFICSDSVGGPIAQEVAPDGSILESQIFSTKFPHIVIERVDRYAEGDTEPEEMTWSIRRVQNQRAQTQVNRLLDAANLAFELIRLAR